MKNFHNSKPHHFVLQTQCQKHKEKKILKTFTNITLVNFFKQHKINKSKEDLDKTDTFTHTHTNIPHNYVYICGTVSLLIHLVKL